MISKRNKSLLEEKGQFHVITVRMAREWIQEKILTLSPRSLEELAAALLRAMNYQTQVSRCGADRGVDVLATPDRLGLLAPRIKIQVKHRPNRRMSAPEVREFLSVLRDGDRGLCISTGGFSREARYEADRSEITVRLIDLEELSALVWDYYDSFDVDGKAILPLQKVYCPLE